MYKIGTNLFIPSQEIYWNYRREQNPHLMVIGKSGSGKTYLLRKILKHFAINEYKKINVFVIDFHGDLMIEEEQTIEFNKNYNTAGIGVFEFDFFSKAGGIYNRVDELIKIFENSFFPQMSPLRKALLRKLLLDVYIRKGYDPEDKSTWNKPLDQLPTLEDLAQLISDIIEILRDFKHKNDLFFSSSLKEFKNLLANKNNYSEEELIKKADLIFKSFKQELLDEKKVSIEEKLGIKDFSFYTKKNVLSALESIEIYINSMIESKIFSKQSPVLDKHKNVFRFNLKYLEDNLMLFIANLIIQRIFTKLRMKYEYTKDNKTDINTYIVIDESKLILPNREKNNDLHYINRIVSEARKFGLGIILASQRISHYSQEMISNISAKVVLNIDESEQSLVKKKIGISDNKIFEQISSKPYGIGYIKSILNDNVVKFI